MNARTRLRAARGAAMVALLLAGCGRYFYTKPGGDFTADSTACIREVGISSANQQYALVTPEHYRRCMLAHGWTREQKVEPVPYGWFRGVENEEVIDVARGPRQPSDSSGAAYSMSRQQMCRQTWLQRSDWRERLPDYEECLRR